MFFDGKHRWLADGFHRYHAHKHAGAIEINADVRNGTKRDAVLFSVGANAVRIACGAQNADKRKAVETLLRDKEWSQWSDREIAESVGVTHPFVASIRERSQKTGNGREKPQVSNHQQMVTVTTAAPEAPVDAGLQNEDFTSPSEAGRKTGSASNRSTSQTHDDLKDRATTIWCCLPKESGRSSAKRDAIKAGETESRRK